MAHSDDEKPWGVCDPNTQHQVWTQWAFVVHPRRPPWLDPNVDEFQRAVTRFFGGASRGHSAELSVREERRPNDLTWRRYLVDWRVEDNRALDEGYRRHILAKFRDFVADGFGYQAVVLLSDVVVLAGDAEEGKPRAQLVVMPTVALSTQLWGQQ